MPRSAARATSAFAVMPQSTVSTRRAPRARSEAGGAAGATSQMTGSWSGARLTSKPPTTPFDPHFRLLVGHHVYAVPVRRRRRRHQLVAPLQVHHAGSIMRDLLQHLAE